MGKYQDKDDDGYVSWYPDPKKPNEPAGAGVNQSVIDSNDADPSVNISGSNGVSSSGSGMQYSAGVYPIYTPGKPATTTKKYNGSKLETVTVPGTEGTVEYLDRNGLKQYLNKNLDTATIKQYQIILKSAGLLPKNYVTNGKLDVKGQFAGAVVKVIGNQQERGVDAETLSDGMQYIKENYSGSGSSSAPALPQANVTSKEGALADIQDEFRDMFGEAAPKEIINAYRDELKALEMSRTTKRKTVNGVSVGTYGVTEVERKNLTNKYLNQYAQIKVTNAATGDPAAVASLTKGNFGVTYTSLKNAYADNGIPMNTAGLNFASMVTESALNPERLKSNLNLVNLHASTLFPALSEKINSGYTVKQLLSPYLQTRADILEEDADGIDLTKMADIAKDPKGLMGLYDYQIALRNDPKWAFTKNAQDSLSQVAKGLAETFGLVG